MPEEKRHKRIARRIQNFYERIERPVSSISLIGGFVFDAITLTRVDEFWENFWVAIHLAVVAICILLINREENVGLGEDEEPERTHFWLVTTLQFFFGGLLSTFIVFYFRSATLAVSWPFLAILALAFIANERLKRHYTRLTFQIGLLFLSILSFAIYLVPVMLRQIGTWVFLVSGGASLVFIWLFLSLLRYVAREKFLRSRRLLFISIAGIFAAMNAMYFANLIPPLPLSLKGGGIYHSIVKNPAGGYLTTREDEGWLGYFKIYDDVHVVPGEAIYAESDVFLPPGFDTTVLHIWQRYDDASKQWITVSRIPLGVVGGREAGYRTYSYNTDLAAGLWRVNVTTPDGAVIGRIRFNVIPVSAEPSLITGT